MTDFRRAMRQRAQDQAIGKQLKVDGIERVKHNSKGWVEWMQLQAQHISNQTGQVDSDDLRRLADDMNYHPHHPNAWGAIFRGDSWIQVGRKKSSIVSNHGREIRVWKWSP